MFMLTVRWRMFLLGFDDIRFNFLEWKYIMGKTYTNWGKYDLDLFYSTLGNLYYLDYFEAVGDENF